MTDSSNNLDSQMSSIADDSINIFRLNIVVIGVYLTVLAFSVERAKLSSIILSPYTIVGLAFWFGTAGSSILTYRAARLRSHPNYSRDEFGTAPEKEQIIKNISGAAFGAFIVVVSLSIGIIDAIIPVSVQSYTVALFVVFGIGIVGIAQVALTGTFMTFYYIDRVGSEIAESFFRKTGVNKKLEGVRLWMRDHIETRIHDEKR